jgi:hypothetical protein
MSGVQEFETVAKFFRQQAGIQSNDPYQDVCDNYGTLMSLMKEYNPKSDTDEMKLAFNTILNLMQYGFDNCHSWVNEDFDDHYESMNNSISYWRSILTEKGIIKE